MIDKELQSLLEILEEFIVPFQAQLEKFYETNVKPLEAETGDKFDGSISEDQLHNIDGLIKHFFLNETKPFSKMYSTLWDIQRTCLHSAHIRVFADEEQLKKMGAKKVPNVNKLASLVGSLTPEQKAAILKQLGDTT
jgi:hypothetical protein